MSAGFRLTSEQSMLREALRELCATESTAAHVLEVWQQQHPFDEGLWQALAANGWLGLCSDESHGGAGMGIVELSLVAEELGRAAAAAPILPSLIAGLVLRESGATSELSTALVEGSTRIALGLSRDGFDFRAPLLERAGGRLSGRAAFVAWAETAHQCLLPMDGETLVCVPRQLFSARPRKTMDLGLPLADVLLREADDLEIMFLSFSRARLFDLSAVAAAAEMLGSMQRCLELSLDYARVRKQFGRAIGTFQAVRHMCADMATEIENTRSVVRAASTALAEASTSAHALCAKLQANRAARIVWTNALQVHAGIGFTWEHELHLHIKRLMSLQGLFGTQAGLSDEVFRFARPA
jgi:alkylation response protein AidB-like acyl-CoA dehydrogenase